MGKPARKHPLTTRGRGRLAVLRRQAERLLENRDPPTGALAQDDLREMLHELQVHELELQMQNEELTRVQLELEESRNRYADLFSFAPVGYLIVDADEVVCEANLAAAGLFGLEPSRLVGRRFWRLVHIDSRNQLRKHLRAVRKSRTRLNCELEFLDQQGRRFTGHLVSEAFCLAGDSRLRIRCAVLDITARREAERARRESEREVVMVSEREQQRIGADLHDGLGQLLTATEFLGAALRARLAAQCPELEPKCAEVCANLREAIAQTRAIAQGLVPVRLGQGGLMDALAELAERTDGLAQAQCRFDCPTPVLVKQPVVAGHLFRIAQEAVNNALRHGNAREVRIALLAADGCLKMRVIDDGCGFDPSKRSPRSLGLDLMQHRATVLGADLNITSEPGRGVVVECVVPGSQA
ncbi:MAG TPA: PAS domain S-box protein [Opitutaceae bacterium]